MVERVVTAGRAAVAGLTDDEGLSIASRARGRRGAVWLAFVASSAAILAAGWFAWGRDATAPRPAAANAELSALRQRVEALEREQASYRTLLAKLSLSAAAPRPATQPMNPAANADAADAVADPRTGLEIYEDLKTTFEAERVDRAWGPGLESRILEIVKSYRGATARAVSCKSSLCQLEIAFESADARTEFELSFSTREPLVGKQIWTQRKSDPDGTLRSVLLVQREEEPSG